MKNKQFKDEFLSYAILAGLFIFSLICSNHYIKHILIMAGIYIIISMGMNLITGFAGQLNLGMAGFFAIGAYTSSVLTVSGLISYWPALLISIILSGIVGFIVGLPALKVKSGVYLVLITASFAGIIQVLANQLTGITKGPMGLVGIPSPRLGSIEISGFFRWTTFIYICAVFVTYIMARLINSRIGRCLMAVKESDVSAQSVGINPTFYKLLSFIISAMFGGFAGSLFAHYMSAISPDIFTFSFSMMCLVMIVIGGVASIPGSIVGAVIVTILPESLRSLVEWQMVIYSAILIVAIVFLPSGVFTLGESSIYYFKKRFALHKGREHANGE